MNAYPDPLFPEQNRPLLTPRMLDFLRAVAAGLTRTETARLLFVEEASVNQRLRMIRRRLGARNSAHLVAIAYEKGLLP